MGRNEAAVSRSKVAYDRLRDDLIDGTLMPGSKLMIVELQANYGLGAIPIREALNRLSAELLVRKHEQRGFSVPPIDIKGFLQIQNARIVIETAALSESIAGQKRDWEDRLVLSFHHLEQTVQLPGVDDTNYLLTDEWAVCHANFHRELLSGSVNTWLLVFSERLFQQSARYRLRRRQVSMQRAPSREKMINEHREIMKSALSGDVGKASDLLAEHYRKSVAIVMGIDAIFSNEDRRIVECNEPVKT